MGVVCILPNPASGRGRGGRAGGEGGEGRERGGVCVSEEVACRVGPRERRALGRSMGVLRSGGAGRGGRA